MQTIVQQHPDDDQIVNEIAKTYVNFGDFTNAEQLVSRLLARNPDNISRPDDPVRNPPSNRACADSPCPC